MSKNANGEGSIYAWRKYGKASGHKGAISYQDENGVTKRYVSYGRTCKDVRDKLERLGSGLMPARLSKTLAAQWRIG